MLKRWVIFVLGVVLVLPLCAVSLPGEARGESGPADPLADSAAAFCRLFMDGEHERYFEMMSGQMRDAITPSVAVQIRSSLTDSNGNFERLGRSWKEDEIEGYQRYRVPAEFEGGVIDLRVVFDSAGNVAGFFHVAHKEPPAEIAESTPDADTPPPYKEDGDLSIANGEIKLACSLTRPPGPGPFPAAMLLTGSGPQNRDEEIFGHRPFFVLSDHLTRGGLAVLRCDDRGVGGSTGDVASSTTEDFAGDALSGVRFLADQPWIDAKRIGLIGHSEGAIVAPLVASRSEQVAFVVMLAGPGVPGNEILAHQMKLLLHANGVSEESTAAILAAQGRLIELVMQNAGDEQLLEAARKLTEAQLAASGSPALDAETLDGMAAQAVQQVASPWFRYFLAYDPAPALRRVRVPVLALNGELDLQVDPRQNLPAIRNALKAGGNQDFTAKELPGLNHLFQTAETGTVAEYAEIKESFSPLALGAIGDWILARFGAAADRPAGGR